MKSERKFDFEVICKYITLVYFCSIYAFKAQRVYIELIWIFTLLLYFISNKIKFTKYLIWSVCFLGICILSNIWTLMPKDTWIATRGVLEIVIIGNLLTIFINNEKKMKFILNCFVLAGIVLVLRIIITNPFNTLGLERIGNELYNSNSMGMALSVSAICSLYIALTIEKKNAIYYILIPIFIILIFLTGSRKAFFFSTLGCLMMYIFSVKRKSKLIFILPISALVFYALYYCIMNIPSFYQILGLRIERLLNIITGNGEIDASSRIRILLINTGVDLWKAKPWLGYGIQSFSTISGFEMYSHNNYIELLVGVGAIGTAIYYSLYIFLVRKLGKLVFSGVKIAIPFYIIIILLIINEFGFVSYGEETFQIILALGVSCVEIFDISRHKNSNDELLASN